MLNKYNVLSFNAIIKIWINSIILLSLQVVFWMTYVNQQIPKNCKLKHMKSLQAHFLYNLLFHIMISKSFAAGLFPGQNSLQFVCWDCVLKIY